MNGILLSWKACKGLSILPLCYPQPLEPPSTNAVMTTTPSSHTNLITEFPSVFDNQVKAMDGEQFHIALTKEAKPFCVKTPRTVPFAYRDKLKAELETLQEQGSITPVTYPTEWCAPIVVTPKKESDSIRMCVDLTHLNRYVKREQYHSATPDQAVADITAEKAKVFTTIDAKKGYHQCPLDETSQDLTTFITPFGRFKFLPAPYGIASISEHYNRRMDEAFTGLPGFRRVVDELSTIATEHSIPNTSDSSFSDVPRNASPSISPSGSLHSQPLASQASTSRLLGTESNHLSHKRSKASPPQPAIPTSVPSSDWSTSYHRRQAYLTCYRRYAHS